jgi:hypothetical protein
MVQKEENPKTTRRAMGITKFYKSKNMKRTIVLLPEGQWRTAKDISLDNGETFTAFLIRALQREINRQLAKLPMERQVT